MPDPYAGGLVKESPYAKKEPVMGRIVAVLRLRMDARELELIKQPSRAVVRGEVHELIVTGEDAGPGSKVDNVAYLGFFEVLNSGVILAGDEVKWGTANLGRLAGFDLTHFPNHLNIVLHSDVTKTGEELGLELGSTVQFSSPA
ncbi:MAG: hypothetical protein HPY55_09830 [Firmicutes bacterium]|nr:hypothetical protein [Bacillota bacterium]